jgi:hypothetical protein
MTTTQVVDGARTRRARLLLACGVVGPPLFVVALLVEGFTRAGYSTWRNYGSQLATGPWGWTQITNFIVGGLLILLSAFGFWQVLRDQGGPGRTWGPILIGVFGLTLVIAGVFVTDPALGYPPGTPSGSNGPKTWHGSIHGVNAIPCFLSLAIATFVFARRYFAKPGARNWASYSLGTGIFQLAFFIGSTAVGALDENNVIHNAPTGILQRISIVTGWLWLSLVALHELRALPRTSAEAADEQPSIATA